MQYMTLRSRPLELEITPDAKGGGGDAYVVQGRGMSKEEVKMLGQDIRFIKLGNAQLRPVREPFLFGAVYWVLLFGILAFFTAVYVALRKQIRESQNAALVRGKRANKVAVQRFRVAKRYMEEQNRHAFYEEMLRALWGYMGDKFNIPVANLTKENVREELHKRGVSVEESQRFTSIITKCDEAQYSPAASAQMSEVYAEGVDIISRIEAVIKDKNAMKRMILCFLLSLALAAVSFAQEPADSLQRVSREAPAEAQAPGSRLRSSCGTKPIRPISTAISMRPPIPTKSCFRAG